MQEERTAQKATQTTRRAGNVVGDPERKKKPGEALWVQGQSSFSSHTHPCGVRASQPTLGSHSCLSLRP